MVSGNLVFVFSGCSGLGFGFFVAGFAGFLGLVCFFFLKASVITLVNNL